MDVPVLARAKRERAGESGCPGFVRFDAPGLGMTAQGVAVLTGGVVTSVQMTNSGSDYNFVPQVYFSSP